MTTETAPAVEQTDAEAAASFAGGFEETPQDKPATTTPAATDDGGKATDAAPAAEAPEYVQITKKQLDDMVAAAAKTASYDQQFSKVFGTIGNMQQLINRLKTPAGLAVKITDEDLAELKEDFPELAGHTKAALERILKRIIPAGTGEEPATTTTEQPAADDSENEAKVLNALRPGWRDIVGRTDDAEKPFRKWLAAQPQEYQDLIHETTSAVITDRAIERFLQSDEGKAATAAPAPKPDPAPKPAAAAPATTTTQPQAPKEAVRRNRIQDAVTPSGTGKAPPPQRETEADAFREGFGSG